MIQEVKNNISIKYLKNNILFLLSGLCFFLLIFHTARLWLVISVVCLIAAFFISVYIKSVFSKFRNSPLVLKIVSILLALGLSYISARRFISNWLPSGKIERLASRIHLSNTMLLSVLAGVLALLSLLFLTLIFSLILSELKRTIFDTLQFTKPKSIFENIKSNILLIFSSFAFMGLNIQLSRNGIFSLLLSYILIVFVFSQVTSIFQKIKAIPVAIKIYSFISSVGICYYARKVFVGDISSSSLLRRVCEKINIDQTILLRWLSAIIALFAIIAVFVLVSLLLNYLIEKLKTVFWSLSKIELIIYSILTIALLGFVSYVFFGSNAFWGTKLNYDIIYTSDSPSLVNSNVYLRLYHGENDLRQPLFAVFAAPFVGFGYALSVPLSHINPVFTPLFMNAIQVLMLITANLMLAKIINLDTIGRVCFMIFTTVTYTTLLFSVMMEQYIVAYFWLIFVIYSYIMYKKATVISISAAGGTLLTSLVLIPTAYENEHSNNTCKIRSFVTAIEKGLLGFFIMLFAFGRLDVLLTFTSRADFLAKFAGGESNTGRIKQYLAFISSCFFSPKAIVDKTTYDHISWQLSKSIITQINIIGIIIITLCLVSFIVNRKNMLTKISALWVCFSVILLCIVGWGSAENGMILYSLYFGWAFIVLLFQLVNWCSEKMNFKYFTPIISSIAIITLAIFNYQGIRDLLSFAFTYYPV